MRFLEGLWMRLAAGADLLVDLWLPAVVLLAPGIAALLFLLPVRSDNRIAWFAFALVAASAIALPLWRTVLAAFGTPAGSIGGSGFFVIGAVLSFGFLGLVLAGKGQRIAMLCLGFAGLVLHTAANIASRVDLVVVIDEDHFVVAGEQVAGVESLESLLRRHPAPDAVTLMWGYGVYVDPAMASPERVVAAKAALLRAGIDLPVDDPSDPRATTGSDLEISILDES